MSEKINQNINPFNNPTGVSSDNLKENFQDFEDQNTITDAKSGKPSGLIKGSDFLKSSLPASDETDYHVRAGRIGGETTKQRHRDSNFYKEIGARGGSTTMARHGDKYGERRKRGGQTTRERYGEEYYQTIAAKAARTKQSATRLRNEAIKALLNEGYKIPTIIKLTISDLQIEPRLQRLSQSGPLAEYLQTRQVGEEGFMFLSQSGKQLSLANTYTVMERHRPVSE